MTIVFLVGLKDDFKDWSPKKKFLGQFIAVLILICSSDFRMSSLNGFLGIYEVNIFLAIPITIFLLVGLINAFNLIDGIDGMASIVGVVISSFFGILFHKLNITFFSILSFSLAATLIAFLRFNISKKRKIFMGDTGSLLVGLILGALAMKLVATQFETEPFILLSRDALPVLTISILIIPSFDIVRVILIRVNKKLPVFSPDRNHMHHILVDYGFSHLKSSLIVGFINALIVATVYFCLINLSVFTSLVIFAVLISMLSYLFFILNKNYDSRRIKVKIRNNMFSLYNLFFNSNYYKKNRLAFNQKLKNIRIFFF